MSIVYTYVYKIWRGLLSIIRVVGVGTPCMSGNSSSSTPFLCLETTAFCYICFYINFFQLIKRVYISNYRNCPSVRIWQLIFDNENRS